MTGDRPITVVTVTFNSGADAVEGLRPLLADDGAGAPLEVVVVDNASSDGSADLVARELPAARLVRSASNAGFGQANNLAASVSRGDPIVLLNPDARLARAGVEALAAFLAAHPRAGAAAPAVHGPGSVESAGAHPSIASLLAQYAGLSLVLGGGARGAWRGFGIPRRRDQEPVRVDWVSGAAMAIPRAAFEAVGGFDPEIFLYAEDIDLCRRLREAGLEVWLLPGVVATHAIGGSQPGASTRWVDGLHLLYRREGGRWLRLRLVLFDLVLAAGLGVRALLAGARRGRGAAPGRHEAQLAASARRALQLARGGTPRDR